ncbi:hypothetical protein OH799_33535 [Nocardia sp. NBC_00881]|uniref:hypothetical protein n=1 Tax=Nocardia sp. NBC_00881 TaxID=2975995 RepID=UPI00386AFDB8|nr:hypothetical protein OH799_33535 [Nocardia sp. NBC_00881]
MSISTPATRPAPARDFLSTTPRVDGWSTGIFGGVLLAGAAALRDPLGLPTVWSVVFGVAMLGGALVLLLIARQPEIRARQANGVVAVNAVSAVAMIALAESGVLDLTVLGVALLLVGAAVVAVFAGLEFTGLCRRA